MLLVDLRDLILLILYQLHSSHPVLNEVKAEIIKITVAFFSLSFSSKIESFFVDCAY